jgi:hypothetical protein
MKISGNQTAIAEILTLLDKDFVHPFACQCPNSKGAHYCECQYQSKSFEEYYGSCYHEYELSIHNGKIESCKLLHKGSNNILTGCIR